MWRGRNLSVWNRPNVSPYSMAEESDTSKVTQNESDSRSHVVDGLLSMIQPVIYETDLRVVGVRQSQNELNKEIERLIAGNVNEDALLKSSA